MRRLLRVLVVLGLLGGLAGCGLSLPRDPDGTLERVSGGTLRVGVSPHPPWTAVSGEDEPTGREIDLVRAFAGTLGADVAWLSGGEEPLVAALERGELDLVVGGLTSDTPWTERAAITKPYAESAGPDGKPQRQVMAAPLGENAFLLTLERFLLAQDLR